MFHLFIVLDVVSSSLTLPCPALIYIQNALCRGEDRIFLDLVCPDLSESCGYMQYLSGDDRVIYISLMILLTKIVCLGVLAYT